MRHRTRVIQEDGRQEQIVVGVQIIMGGVQVETRVDGDDKNFNI